MTDHLLAARVHDALAELYELRSGDPAAAGAMRAIKLTRWTLEQMQVSSTRSDRRTVS